MGSQLREAGEAKAESRGLPERIRNVIEWVLFLPARNRHRRKSRNAHRVRAEAIATVRQTLSRIRFLRANNMYRVLNVGLYLLVLDQDLADLTDDIMFASGARKRRFVAKHLAVLLYEAAEDLPQLLGKRFRESILALGASSEQTRRVNEATAGVNQFWVSSRSFLKDIRNTVGAHREHDALFYLEKLERLETLEVMKHGAGLSLQLNRLIGVITDLTSLTAGMPALFDDMKRSNTVR